MQFIEDFSYMNYGIDNIFKTSISPSNIDNAREDYYSFPTNWMDVSNPIKYTLDNFKLDDSQPRFVVDVDNTEFECLFLKKDSKKLFVNFSGGGREGHSYPLFLRWKYGNRLDANIICIEDPMQKDSTNTCVKWYYGNNKVSYLEKVKLIVEKAISMLDIKKSDVYFLGSSGGGYAALYMANTINGTNAVAYSPQVILANWGKTTVKYFQSIGIDLTSKDEKFHRNVLSLNNNNSVFFLVFNYKSTDDFEGHYIPFCRNHNIESKYGITQQQNFLTWIHASNGFNLHGCNPEIELPLIINLIEQHRNGVDINNFTNISYILNERINKYYEIENKYLNLKQFIAFSAINSIKKFVSANDNYLVFNRNNRTLSFLDKSKLSSDYIPAKLKVINDTKCFVRIGKFYVTKNLSLSKKKKMLKYKLNKDMTFKLGINKKYINNKGMSSFSILELHK